MESVLGIIMAPINLIKEDRRLSSELRRSLRSMKQELEMIKADMESYDELQVQELAYDIEDFMHDIWIPGASGPILTAIGMDPRDEHLERIRGFKESIQRLEKRQHDQSPQPRQTRGSPAQYTYAREEELLGIHRPKREILDLLVLSPPSEGLHPAEQKKLKVISILGCRGVGKTALARAVHDDPGVRRAFGCAAYWVVASECNDVGDLLREVVKVIGGAGGATSASLHDILANKRYLVFFDDVKKPELLQDILKAFPENGMISRIIVTTSIRSVAATFSTGSYVYTMQCLDKLDSENLFWRKVYGCDRKPRTPALVYGSESIFTKCNGLPLALISIADHLSKRRNNLKKCDCENASQTFDSDYLTDNKTVSAFGVLTQSYDSLPDHDHKNCMLSLSIFPQGHQINSKSLVRRLVAEGLVAGDARTCYDELVDRSIVEPVLIGNYSNDAVRCHVHGTVLDYIIKKSVSKNFVTLIGEHAPTLRTQGSTVARVRRVAVHSGRKEIFDEVAEKSAIRSLTMFNSQPFDFQSCKMLRLLDLEGCSGVDRRFLDGICDLLLLKYLSLRKSDVDMLPTKIEKLQHLETLDVRETRVGKLPMEVIMLPKLAHLFGMFVLPDMPKETSKLEKFLTKKSVLHTIAGINVNQTQVINDVILKARKLKKVKVWSKNAPAVSSTTPRKRKFLGFEIPEYWPTQLNHNAPTMHALPEGNNRKLASSLQKRFTALDSVSIYSNNGLCKDFVASLWAPCTIRSIKLRGLLDSLPDPPILSRLCNLTKLQLFSTGLSSDALRILQSLPCLEYLKLSEHRRGFWEGNFGVENDGFQSLHHLCFEAPKFPKLHFKHGALESLLSLHLLHPYSSSEMQDTMVMEDNLEVEGISLLEKISEVILPYSVGDTKMQALKSVANGHPNRPSVKKQPGPANNTTV
ncbi:hypothetical protein ACP4OV_002068 [Aristida adscensionis]